MALVQVKLRISSDLRHRLKREAKKRKRSLSNEIANRIERSFEVPVLKDEIAAAVVKGLLRHIKLDRKRIIP